MMDVQAVQPSLNAPKNPDSSAPDAPVELKLTILAQLQKELEALEDPGKHPCIQALGHIFCLKELPSLSHGTAMWRPFLFAAAFMATILIGTVLLEPPTPVGFLPS